MFYILKQCILNDITQSFRLLDQEQMEVYLAEMKKHLKYFGRKAMFSA